MFVIWTESKIVIMQMKQRAAFTVRVTGGKPGEVFEMTAVMSYDSITASDVSALKVRPEAVSILIPVRNEPDPKQPGVIPAIVIPAGEFSAGPNPVSRQSGGVNFFWQGGRLENGKLLIYNASGRLVKRVNIRDNSTGNHFRRQVGSWDLTDSRSRPVPEGTYVVKGTINAKDGKREKISVIMGVVK